MDLIQWGMGKCGLNYRGQGYRIEADSRKHGWTQSGHYGEKQNPLLLAGFTTLGSRIHGATKWQRKWISAKKQNALNRH